MKAKKKSSQNTTNKNTVETLQNFGSSMAKNTASEFKKIGTGVFNQLIGNYDRQNQPLNQSEKTEPFKSPEKPQETIVPKQTRKEFTIFSYQNYYETNLIKKEIKQLTESIKKELEYIKKSNQSLISEVRDIEKLTIEDFSGKTGIYHVRFLEIILSLLRKLGSKVNESKTWLTALISKKKKRGSLFMSMSKKKGTQYSLSNELNITRAVQ